MHVPPLLASLSLGNVYALPSHGLKKVVAASVVKLPSLVGFWHAPRFLCSVSPSDPHEFSQRSVVHPDRNELSTVQWQMAETV